MNSSVDGSVIRIDRFFVLCELFTEPEIRTVSLPLTMFNGLQLRVGMPFSLIAKTGTMPTVKARQIDREKARQGAEIFDEVEF